MTVSPRVVVGRGVALWVNQRGGNLYVWTEEFGAGFGQARTDTHPPVDVEFERFEGVVEFTLWLERDAGFSKTLRLGRRWLGLRDANGGAIFSSDLAPLSPFSP